MHDTHEVHRFEPCTAHNNKRKQISDEIKKIGARGKRRKPSRPAQKLLEQLKRDLYSYNSGDKQKQLERLDDELRKRKLEHNCQKTLSFVFEYMDAADFSIIFNEIMDREFRWLKQQNQAKLREIFSIIENWYNNHKQDVPLKKSGEKNI